MRLTQAYDSQPASAAFSSTEDRRNLGLALTAGLVIRAVLIFAYRPFIAPDSPGYLALAHRLGSLHLTGYSAARTPGYPLLLLVLGYSPTAAWCAQAILGLLTTALVYWLVRRLGGSPTMALVAALLYTTSFGVMAFERQVLTETLTSFLLVGAGSICVVLVDVDRRRPALVALLAVTLTYLCLVRSDFVLTALCLVASVLVVWYVRGGSSRRSLLRPALAMLLPPLIGLAAWAVVNKESSGVLTVSGVLGHDMIDHMAPYVNVQPGRDRAITSVYVAWRTRVEAAHGGDYAETSWSAEGDMEKASHLNSAHVASRLLSIAEEAIEHHPVPYVTSSVRQWPSFWLPPNYAYDFEGGAGASFIHLVWKVQRALQLLIAAAFLVLCAAEAVRRVRRRPAIMNTPSVILALAVLVGTLSPIFFGYGSTGRYGYPYFPVFLAVTFAVAGAAAKRLPMHRISR